MFTALQILRFCDYVIPETEQMPDKITWRDTITMVDVKPIRELVASTDKFNEAEVAIAEELCLEWLEKGEDRSGYIFLVAERDGAIAGYTCYGPIHGSDRRYEIYWIAVEPGKQGKGFGKVILAETERRIADRGGVRIYIETSTCDKYKPTQGFYLHNGYSEAARMEKYYSEHDGKLVYVKDLRTAPK
jgi:GNAT superfamily N-acetyltransferase